MTPTFSVIIPTYERPTRLSSCLAALSDLDYPRECFEVIVVNDGGCPIDEAIAPFLGRMNVAHVTQKHSGPAAARNAGVARARGKYVAFTDDDCRPHCAWLRQLERQLAAGENVLVGGMVVNALEDNACSAASQLLVTYLCEYYNAVPGQALFFTSNNMAMPRDAFMSIGGFDQRFRRSAAEDRELCERWSRSGRSLVFAETALIQHSHLLTILSFWRQHFQYGRGAWQYRLTRAERDASPLKFEPLRFYIELLRYPWSSGVRRPSQITVLFFISQAANAMGFLWAKLLGSDAGAAVAIKAS